MNLVVDIGNSNIVIGLESKGSYPNVWRIPTDVSKISAEYEILLRQNLLENDIETKLIEAISISSVVPDLTDPIARACSNLFGIDPFIIDGRIIEQLELGIDNPYEIGTDLASNAVGAFELAKHSCIVVDFGTALTFTSVSQEGKILGVAIAPGVKTAMKALSSNTAKLPEIPLEIPERFIGRNTIQAMQSGIMQGYVGMVKHMIAETSKEIGEKPVVIATGGLSFVFKPLLGEAIDQISPNLTLDGILTIKSKAAKF